MILHGKGFMTAEFFAKKTLFAKYLYEFTDSLDKCLENKFESSWRQTEYYGWNIIHVFPDPLFPYMFTCGHFWRHCWVIQTLKQVWLFLYVMKTRWILDLLTCCESIREYGFSSCMEFRKKKKKRSCKLGTKFCVSTHLTRECSTWNVCKRIPFLAFYFVVLRESV